MFREVPPADAYILKSVLHNWSDDECVRILANLRRAVVGTSRVFVVDFFVPGPEEPHFSKLFDIHMMLMVTGRERTAAELAELLAAAGWRYDAWHRVPNAFHSVKRAERYPRTSGGASPRSRGSPHGHRGVAAGFGP
jgi:hypothetical protein